MAQTASAAELNFKRDSVVVLSGAGAAACVAILAYMKRLNPMSDLQQVANQPDPLRRFRRLHHSKLYTSLIDAAKGWLTSAGFANHDVIGPSVIATLPGAKLQGSHIDLEEGLSIIVAAMDRVVHFSHLSEPVRLARFDVLIFDASKCHWGDKLDIRALSPLYACHLFAARHAHTALEESQTRFTLLCPRAARASARQPAARASARQPAATTAATASAIEAAAATSVSPPADDDTAVTPAPLLAAVAIMDIAEPPGGYFATLHAPDAYASLSPTPSPPVPALAAAAPLTAAAAATEGDITEPPSGGSAAPQSQEGQQLQQLQEQLDQMQRSLRELQRRQQKQQQRMRQHQADHDATASRKQQKPRKSSIEARAASAVAVAFAATEAYEAALSAPPSHRPTSVSGLLGVSWVSWGENTGFPWRAQVPDGRYEDGGTKYRTVGLFATAQEASAARSAALPACDEQPASVHRGVELFLSNDARSKSGYVGVRYVFDRRQKSANRWTATCDGRHVGSFATCLDAAHAYALYSSERPSVARPTASQSVLPRPAVTRPTVHPLAAPVARLPPSEYSVCALTLNGTAFCRPGATVIERLSAGDRVAVSRPDLCGGAWQLGLVAAVPRSKRIGATITLFAPHDRTHFVVDLRCSLAVP